MSETLTKATDPGLLNGSGEVGGRRRWCRSVRSHQADQLPGLAAFWAGSSSVTQPVRVGEPVGFIAYHLAGGECQIVTINSLLENIGIGLGGIPIRDEIELEMILSLSGKY